MTGQKMSAPPGSWQASGGAGREQGQALSLDYTLHTAGINLQSFIPGEHRAQCPHCTKGRERTVSVKIERGGGAVWYCSTGASGRDRPARGSG